MRRFAMLTAVGLILGLAGCASSGGAKTTAVMNPNAYDGETDWAKMTVITREAESRGYRIVWVHPPQKAKATPERGIP